ncbi:cortical vesicle protein CV34-53 precursor [Strongylocentrotus purpuratus]|uniref:C1q domain-containing protein n=1 Tax=Strongylocentrotus purpuratus TaxID=7668 RepID=A0A7M6W623_STRPU|nr:cortical vesicle protein CV34-53 precursor [Strongylocentrotus purpuratus]|eukprot:XP_011669194.1 PREDICTED: cortical vesicle protein CV34-53 precursor [Strongylocentrotus purpuratus]
MASGPSYMLLCTLMLMIVREGVATSQFLNDFGLCIVDKGFTASAGDFMFTTDPVVERGSAASFIISQDGIKINDDGTYLFIIHRAGVIARDSQGSRPDPFLLKISNTPNVEIVDTGEESICTVHVLAELKRENIVSISIPSSLNTVPADENRPFIFSAFLLYHTPIVSFPRARQSAFSVNLNGVDLSVADSIIKSFAPPTVNIGDEFDRMTGVYTAPFEGLYMFHLAVTFSSEADGEGRAAVAFQTNGNTKAQVSDQVQSIPQVPAFRDIYTYYLPPQNSAITVAQNLNQGDKITLRNVIAVSGVRGSVTFVGYLLS